jgi:hypothetical protein
LAKKNKKNKANKNNILDKINASVLVQTVDAYATKLFGVDKPEFTTLLLLLAAKGGLSTLELGDNRLTQLVDNAIEVEAIAGVNFNFRDLLMASLIGDLKMMESITGDSDTRSTQLD